jgi:hypothetical protein
MEIIMVTIPITLLLVISTSTLFYNVYIKNQKNKFIKNNKVTIIRTMSDMDSDFPISLDIETPENADICHYSGLPSVQSYMKDNYSTF